MLKFSSKNNNPDIRIGIVSRGRAYADRQNAIAFSNLTSSSPVLQSSVRLGPRRSSGSLSPSASYATLSTTAHLYECRPIAASKSPPPTSLPPPPAANTAGPSCNNSVRRLYAMSYLPNGFFSRLITRILCDNIVKECLLGESCVFEW